MVETPELSSRRAEKQIFWENLITNSVRDIERHENTREPNVPVLRRVLQTCGLARP